MRDNRISTVIALVVLAAAAGADAEPASSWITDTQGEWAAAGAQRGLAIEAGVAAPTGKAGKAVTYTSVLQRYETKRSAKSLRVTPSPVWRNWAPIEHLGPANLRDAPVLLTIGPGNYWAFGRYDGRGKQGFTAEPAQLDGFDMPLMTTPWARQYDAPGGLEKSLGGYHAWQSRDMVHWVHHGPVTERFSRWVTSAEYADGKAYIFYDFPNDQDPHVYEDDNLFDGKPGRNLGLAFQDPSDGSDAAFIRDPDGRFHVIYEDWSPIDAGQRSWDSPLAGHAVSDNGPIGYTILEPAVDHRTRPTGRFATYRHPHWAKEDPDHYKTNVVRYEIHEPEQPAYGDWAAIAIGGRYYLFGDYDPAGGHEMSVGWFTSDDINQPFQWCDHIGQGHPDPDIAFAEGRFYLITQRQDFVSPGPWVETVEARLGVDTDNDGKIDQWTDWRTVEETYDYIAGFSKQVARTPATLDASGLEAGFGFRFELKITDRTDDKAKPMLDRVTVTFE